MEITKFWNEKRIRIRKEDRYVSLTDIAKSTGKLVADWLRLNSTKDYLHTLNRIMGIPIDTLIEKKVGNLGDNGGTFGHPKVSLRFAQWCSPELAVQVDFWVDELLTTGSVSLQPKLPQTYIEALEALVASEKEKEAIAAEKAKTEIVLVAAHEVIREQKPKVKMAETFLETDGDYSIKELADMLDFRAEFPGYTSYGQNTVFSILREVDILITGGRHNNLPYERYTQYFTVRAYTDSRFRPQVRINSRGVRWLMERYNLKHR